MLTGRLPIGARSIDRSRDASRQLTLDCRGGPNAGCTPALAYGRGGTVIKPLHGERFPVTPMHARWPQWIDRAIVTKFESPFRCVK
jgi:hypothetical protein